MMTPQFDRYITPARQHPQIWRLVLGMVIIVAVYLIGIATIFATIRLASSAQRALELATKITEATTPVGMFLLFASFLGATIGVFIATRLLHKRSIASLFGPRVKTLRDFTLAAASVMAINALLLALISFWLVPVANLNFTLWVTLVPLTIVGILIQTATEELVFRGYLQQQLAARFRSPLIWMLLPSLIFGALHYSPATTGQNTWLIVAAATLFALAAADLTRLTGNLGAAWGFHFANNLWAIALLAVDGNLTGLALYVTPYSATDTTILPTLIMADMAVLLVLWLTLRRLMTR